MGRKLTTEEFIEKAQKVHGNTYDYSKINYVNAKDKLNIICNIHGSFLQNSNNHLQGKNCPKCAKIKKIQSKKKSNIYIIDRYVKIHGDKYDYSLVEYEGCDTNGRPSHGTV